MKNILYLLLFALLACQTPIDKKEIKNQYAIIPQPLHLQAQKGGFKLENKVLVIVSDSSLQKVANLLDVGTPNVEKFPDTSQQQAIIFKLNELMTKESAYTLSVNPKRIIIQSKTPKGAFYAIQTIQQLFQNENYIPSVEIQDEARFAYRGMHLDVSRHFFSVAVIKKYIDLLAYHKFNRFHWHLTDDQGWRIEIKKYPKLTQTAAFRKETLIGHYSHRPHRFDGKKYGGFYNQTEVKEIVQYAAERFITVIPEIEMPGHSKAVLAAYPEFACQQKTFEVATKWGVFNDVLCPKEETFTFLENVLTEVMDLFPSSYIHIGGDECPKKRWKESTFCQQLIKKEGLKNEHELQSYFIKRIEKFLNSKGRNIIGWDEILEGGLAPNASVMSWRGTKGGIDAAQQRHNVVMTPTSHCYFDYYQALSPNEPIAIGGFLPLQKVYEYEPIPEELNDTEAQYILGVQGNVWTEYIQTPEQLFYMAFPRACALAEVAWSSNSTKNYTEFTQRLAVHLERLKAMNIKSANHLYDVKCQIESRPKLKVLLSKEVKEGSIHYTLDGTTPTSQSPIYTTPIPINKALVLKAQTFVQQQTKGYGTEQIFNWHKAVNKKIRFEQLPHIKYGKKQIDVVVNSILAHSQRFKDSEWLGFSGIDAVAIIDFGTKTKIEKVETRFFKGRNNWIYLPKNFEVWRSDDGENFEFVAKTTTINDKKTSLKFSVIEAQFLKIKATNFGKIPANAVGAGHGAWLFLDEIVVD